MMAMQRGNVTLITAFTAMLMVMVVALGAGLSNSAGESTRMQAASDQAALTAAESYIAVVNDEVAFDLIDWGLGFISRMAEVVESLGEAIGAVPFLEWLGAAITAVGEFVQAAADEAKSVFDGVKSALNDVLDQAKSILAIINATVAAANNGYLGFLLPSGVLNQAGQSKYTKKDIQDFVDHAQQPLGDDTLTHTLWAEAMHTIWGTGVQQASDCKDKNGNPCGVPTCGSVSGTSQYCGQQQEKRSPGHDTFNLWPTTANCVDPPLWTDVTQPKPAIPAGAWHRPCDEKAWLLDQLRSFYLDDELSLRNVRLRINFNVPANTAYDSSKPTLFDDGGDPGAQQAAWDALVSAEKALDGAALGNDPDPKKSANTATGFIASYYETTPLLYPGPPGPSLPPFKTPFGSNTPRPYCIADIGTPHAGFICAGTLANAGTDLCKPATAPANPPNFTDEEKFPCWNFWGFNPDNSQKATMQKRRDAGPLPANYPTDYRKTQYYAADVSGSQALSTWKAYKLVAHSAGDIADNQKDVNESFVELNQVKPNNVEVFLNHLAGKEPPGTRWTITGSKAIIHRADNRKDAVHAVSLCNNFSDHDTSTVLGFIPKTAYGWCKALLGAFDTFITIYNAIHDFFYNSLINPLRSFSIDLPIVGNICPFCWLADIIEGFVNYILGPSPPDARTYHVALVTVGCVPAVQQVADVASNFNLEAVLKLVINGTVSHDPSNSTCTGATDGTGA